MSMQNCGAPTQQGGACRWPYRECQFAHHRAWRIAAGLPVPKELPRPDNPLPGHGRETPGATPPPELLRDRDLHGLAWWLAEAALRGSVESREAAVVASLIRVLAALGPPGLEEDELLLEVELRALIAHGIPPRTEGEWARAAALFDDAALAEIRRWPPLVDADGDHDAQPLRFGEVAAVEVEVPLLVEDEDGVEGDL